MRDVSQTTALVWDNGLGLCIAERLARDCKRVLYFSPWEKERTIHAAIIGDGIGKPERCRDPWDVKDDVDIFVFPDVGYVGEQLELESQGRAVWGSRRASRLETDREYFVETLETLGLEVPKYQVVEGISKLRQVLREKEDCWIKISTLRGSFETAHFRSWRLDENLLDLWAVKFGAARELIRFLVFEAINTPLEIGGDGYNVRGNWPSLMLHGIESKDKSYLAAVTPYDEMPEQVRRVNEAFAPLLAQYRYANEWSVEIRIKGEHFYFTDATTRLGLPSTGSQLELWSNFSEIVIGGAHGELVEPEPTAKFSCELILSAKGHDAVWPTVEIPEELKQWVKLADCCEVDGIRSFPREGDDEDTVGWLVSIGDSPQEAVDVMKEHVSFLPEGLSADIAPLAEILKEIETEENKGIEFSGQPIPEPSTVLE